MNYLQIQQTPEATRVGIHGDWIIAHADALEAELSALRLPPDRPVSFQPRQPARLDLTGAWLLWRKVKALRAQGYTAELDGFDSTHFRFLETLPEASPAPPVAPLRGVHAVLHNIGRFAVQEKEQNLAALAFLGRILSGLVRVLPHPRRWRVTDVAHHLYTAGIQAIPIVSLIAFLISIVLAYQGADQLARFGARIYTIDLVAISMLREMGVLLTAIMVAGRSGSAFAAQIGFMKINEEVNALRTMGFDPFEILVIPRIVALVIALPLLTLLADLMGLAGAALLSVYMLDISLVQFGHRVIDTIGLNTFLVGIIKAPVFAFLIGFIGTMRGMQVSGSSESVGRQTTNAVVQSIFLVILADALFSILFSWLGI
ncbi:MAG TPA: ABC transporter permease [Chromatiales bacterium]|nr:ABC transporter permease [Chromatiales bacterium]